MRKEPIYKYKSYLAGHSPRDGSQATLGALGHRANDPDGAACQQQPQCSARTPPADRHPPKTRPAMPCLSSSSESANTCPYFASATGTAHQPLWRRALSRLKHTQKYVMAVSPQCRRHGCVRRRAARRCKHRPRAATRAEGRLTPRLRARGVVSHPPDGANPCHNASKRPPPSVSAERRRRRAKLPCLIFAWPRVAGPGLYEATARAARQWPSDSWRRGRCGAAAGCSQSLRWR